MAFHITSDLDFDKGGCVIQIEWTKALCKCWEPMLLIIVYRSEKSISNIYGADSCVYYLNSKTA